MLLTVVIVVKCSSCPLCPHLYLSRRGGGGASRTLLSWVFGTEMYRKKKEMRADIFRVLLFVKC